jgi:hypothetical protein
MTAVIKFTAAALGVRYTGKTIIRVNRPATYSLATDPGFKNL